MTDENREGKDPHIEGTKGVQTPNTNPASTGPTNPVIPPAPIPDDHYRNWVGTLVPSVSLAEEAVRTLLRYLGEDPDRDGLKETPSRVVKALREMTEGYHQPGPSTILSKVFQQACDEMIVVRNIPFTSICEHHLMVYQGKVDIGYLPAAVNPYNRIPSRDATGPGKYMTLGTKVVGLSKMARLVDHYSKRLTIQERLTRDIANAMMGCLDAQGVGVTICAEHSCMSCRGVMKSEVEMVTSVMLGVFRSKPEARQEFFSLCQR